MPLPLRSALRLREGGLLLVILVLATLLTWFSGRVSVPVFSKGPDGMLQRVFTTDADGDQVPLLVEKNKFLNQQNLAQLAKDTSFIAIMAVGMTIVIITGGIDLSVGAIYALASVVGALVLRHYGLGGPAGEESPWLGMVLGVTAALGTAALCGLVSGGLIVALRVHPFIITLGGMAVIRGIAFVATKGQSIGGFPSAFREFVRYEVGDGLSVVPLFIMLLVTAVGSVLLGRLVFGRHVYAIGGNEVAARFSGIKVERAKVVVYLISGITAGVAALLSIGYYGAATSGDGQGYELNVIAAAVVGGASLTGGKGSALGAVLGALIIQMISSGIVILGIDQNYSQIIIGSVVIVAVVLDNLNTWLANRRALSRQG